MRELDHQIGTGLNLHIMAESDLEVNIFLDHGAFRSDLDLADGGGGESSEGRVAFLHVEVLVLFLRKHRNGREEFPLRHGKGIVEGIDLNFKNAERTKTIGEGPSDLKSLNSITLSIQYVFSDLAFKRGVHVLDGFAHCQIRVDEVGFALGKGGLGVKFGQVDEDNGILLNLNFVLEGQDGGCGLTHLETTSIRQGQLFYLGGILI
jgi:hypothetical protein